MLSTAPKARGIEVFGGSEVFGGGRVSPNSSFAIERGKVAGAAFWLQVTVPNSWQWLRVPGLGPAGAISGIFHPLCS